MPTAPNALQNASAPTPANREPGPRWPLLPAALLAALAIAALVLWLRAPISIPLGERGPGADGEAGARPKSASAQSDIASGGQFRRIAQDPTPPFPPGAWTRFRGERFDNVCTDPTPLADSWPADGPKILWSIDLGEGHSGPALRDGRVYLLDYDEEKRADTLRCFALADGKEIWRRWYRVQIKRNHGISRTTPAIDGRAVVTLGPKGHLLCTDTISGDARWGVDLAARFDAEIPNWYTGQCPIIHDGTVVVAPGGSAILAGFDLATGALRWQTPNPDKWKMSHSSIMLVDLLDRPAYVYLALGGAIAASAAPADRGVPLWKTTAFNVAVAAPSPVAIAKDRLLLTAGYGSGSVLLKIARDGDRWSVEPLRRLEKTEFACEQHTPILHAGHLFTIMPKDAGPLREQMVCARLDGSLAWSSGEKDRFGLGPYLVADGKLLILDDDGTLTLARATPDGWTRLARAKLLDGRDAWAPMALAGGRLLLRDSKRMICLDIRR